MQLRIWPFVGIAFLVLLGMAGLSAWEVSHKTRALDAQTARVHRVYQEAANILTKIQANVYRASLMIRVISPNSPAEQLAQASSQLTASRDAAELDSKRLIPLFGSGQQDHVERLRQELKAYWNSAEVVIQEVSRGGVPASQILDQKTGQRESILEMTTQMNALNALNVDREEHDIAERAQDFRAFLKKTTLLVLLFGFAIACATTLHLARMEREAGQQKQRAERAEFELRRLSNQLVRAQEDERKTISRELHDEVGQILTGLRLELGSFGSFGPADNSAFRERLDSLKSLAEDALRAVRDLAMLLRPSMLDDLGLPAALRWQAKEFARRTGIETAVHLDGDFNNLPDAQRTCLYRVIQEAMTNSSRHANAKHVVITLREDKDVLSASVQDDGQGFQKTGFRTHGLGLLGMEERVRELQGSLTIDSQPGQGTAIRVELPLLEGVEADGAAGRNKPA